MKKLNNSITVFATAITLGLSASFSVLAEEGAVDAAMMEKAANAAAQYCDLPESSPIIPDGNVASLDELVAAQGAVKAYQENLAVYRDCLDKKASELTPESEGSDALLAAVSSLRNASVDLEKVTADEFNVARIAYMARQPQK